MINQAHTGHAQVGLVRSIFICDEIREAGSGDADQEKTGVDFCIEFGCVGTAESVCTVLGLPKIEAQKNLIAYHAGSKPMLPV